MRLYKYLNEELNAETLDELVSYLQKNCDKFLNTLEKMGGASLIYSGRKENDDFIIKNVRKNRVPRDTPKIVHETLNQYFEESTGVRLRSESVFVLTDASRAKEYGTPYAIFPVGKYQIGYSPKINDLYLDLIKELSDVTGIPEGRNTFPKFFKEYSIESGEGKEYGEEYKKRLKDIAENYVRGFPTEKSDKELMLVCDSYVGVKMGNIKQVLDALGLRNSVDM